MKVTIQSIGSTGTPQGWGSYFDWGGCERAAWLSANQEEKPGLSGVFGLDVGTVGHAYLEMYYRRAMESAASADRIDTNLIRWVDPAETDPTYQEKVYKEAERCFRAYRANHPPREFGKPRAVEQGYVLPSFFGYQATFRPDLEICLTENQAVTKGLPGKGWYTVDHKFLAQEKRDELQRLHADLRFTAYNMMYKQHFPRRTYHGAIVNIVRKTKEVAVTREFISYPGVEDQRRLRHALELFAARRAEAKRRSSEYFGASSKPLANPYHCVGPYSICEFFKKECPGY